MGMGMGMGIVICYVRVRVQLKGSAHLDERRLQIAGSLVGYRVVCTTPATEVWSMIGLLLGTQLW